MAAAERFLAGRGWKAGERSRRAGDLNPAGDGGLTQASAARPQSPQTPSNSTWQPLGPDAVVTPGYGLVSGRVSALALDPSDATGNHLYVGTTGGGVWAAQNAATSNAAQVVFSPLTDAVGALSGARDASISIGALTVQPGGTGVILAGTGDPNDALDSYYGAGILRSADGGNSWSLIRATGDFQWSFDGEGFAGFAWSTANPQLVVAAVSQAYEGTLVNALAFGRSYEGLYYSADAGVTWNLATITDGAGQDVQGPTDSFVIPDGNAATAVVWNPVRQLFLAAVRFHGYYQSLDGITWTRMAAQPGAGFDPALCPTNAGQIDSLGCPILRGALAVNPLTGDTFAWSVDIDNQDQGLWQDQCAIASGSCGNQQMTFAKQWNTQALETNTISGPATIANGDYNLALTAVPYALEQGADTWLLAGANDLWRCSLAMGCVWRNTTNAFTCMSGQVTPFQHALAWNTGNPLEILVGNDGGLWRSLDAIGETGQVCNASDATHFQNLNGGLGSLGEVESLAMAGNSPYTMMTGLGVNGTAGLKATSAPATNWPQILGGWGGPVGIDSFNPKNWYVNDEVGVSIYLCSDPSSCDASSFGTTPVVTDADVGGDGYGMTSPAPFLVDPLDATQLLIATCRLWRGPASGVGWTKGNVISPILDSGALNTACSGDALIRSIAAFPLGAGKEAVYLGMYGSLNGGSNLPGHVLSAVVDTQSGTMPVWNDLTLNPVANSPYRLNQFGMDISSIYVDPQDATGKTVYLTVEGFPSAAEPVETVYGSTDGGAHWASLMSNLPHAPASSVVVDPQSAATVYVATDAGVYFTTQVANCSSPASTCWSEFGTGLPEAPVTTLNASLAPAPAQVLTAGTYGRGVWQTPLCSASGPGQTSASTSASQLTFASLPVTTASSAQTLTVTNTGTVALAVTSIAMSDAVDFSETDNCTTGSVAAGSTCTIQVTFQPQATGSLTGRMAIYANICGGQLTVGLAGTGTSASEVTFTSGTLAFGNVTLRTPNPPQQPVGVNTPIAIASVAITPPFTIAGNTCGPGFTPPGSCQVTVEFAPTTRGPVSGTLLFSDQAGTQTVTLTGTGQTAASGVLNTTLVSFPPTAVGQSSASLAVPTLYLSNTGDLPLNCIVIWAGPASTTASNCVPIPSTGEFAATDTCNGQLAGPGQCTVSVVFTPNSQGPRTGTLWINDALGTQQVALSGTGVQAATLSISSNSPAFANNTLTFANQDLNVASAPAVLTITNSGGVAAGIVGFLIPGSSVPGSPASYFATGTTTCTAPLAPGGSCTVPVIFTPGAAGASSAALNIAAAGAKPVTVPLNGTALAPSGLNVAPPQLTFGATVVGSTSAAQTVMVSNTSNVQASQLTIVPSAGFVLAQNGCPASLAAGANCTVGVEFSPTSTGAVTGALTVTSAAIANAATVTLTGTGAVASGIQVTPASIDFAATGVGLTSSATTVTVTNTGIVAALDNLALQVPAGFQLVNNTCAAALGPGTSCTAGVEFAPTAAGAQAGSLTVTSSTISTGASVPLNGMGFDFTVTISGPDTQSEAAGLSAVYTLVLKPLNGSSGTFTLACDALPTNALCVFSPAGETLPAGATGNVTVQVSTGRATALARPLKTSAWGMLPLVCGLLLLPLGGRRRRRLLDASLLLVLLGLLSGGMGACTSSGGGGGGGGGTGGGGGGAGLTPAGTYSIPVTVTSTGVSHSKTVTLTVD
ncbi:MAG: choice-of-anchor D domain-containing protein [Terracidiphilus sp.]|nr:choice-of-anchor D domain-containing protein [Terracidiphilus sp.]